MQVLVLDLICELSPWVHIWHKKSRTEHWWCGQLSMCVSSLGLTGREETFWSFGSGGEWKKSPSRLFKRRSFTGNCSAALCLRAVSVFTAEEQLRCHTFTALPHHLKKAQHAARWEARIKSDLEGDESDGGTRVLNPSEWMWRSLAAAGSSLTQLSSFLKKMCQYAGFQIWIFWYYLADMLLTYNVLDTLFHCIPWHLLPLLIFLAHLLFFLYWGHTCRYQYISCWNQLPQAGLMKLRVSLSVWKW